MSIYAVNTLIGTTLLFLGALILRLAGSKNFNRPAFIVTLAGYALIAYGTVLFFLGV